MGEGEEVVIRLLGSAKIQVLTVTDHSAELGHMLVLIILSAGLKQAGR